MLTFFLCHYLMVFQNYITDYDLIFRKFMSFEYLPELGTKINDLDTPALVIDLDLVENNLFKEFIILHEVGGLNAKLIPFEYCNRRVFAHPQVASPRR